MKCALRARFSWDPIAAGVSGVEVTGVHSRWLIPIGHGDGSGRLGLGCISAEVRLGGQQWWRAAGCAHVSCAVLASPRIQAQQGPQVADVGLELCHSRGGPWV
jgi:hypothetical protein